MLGNKCVQHLREPHLKEPTLFGLTHMLSDSICLQTEVTSTEIRPIPQFGLLKYLYKIDATG